MERFPGSVLLLLGNLFGNIVATAKGHESEVLFKASSAQDIEQVKFLVTLIRDECRKLGLTISTMTAERMVQLFSNPSSTSGQFTALVEELKGRMVDELAAITFLHLDENKTQYYENPLSDLNEVITRFPSAEFDLEEAAKCYALGRNMASVVHSMRVLEVGLNTLAARLGVPFDQPNWHNLIERIDKTIKDMGPSTGADWKEHQQFYSEASIHFFHVKNAWRNYVMHVKQQIYDDERAKLILEHVQRFMRHLATRLSELP